MKKTLLVLAALLCLAVMVLVLPAAATGAQVVKHGTCGADGSDVAWTYYDDGTLVISGTGAMKDYAFSGYKPMLEPWLEYEQEISRVIVEEGITTIGAYAFSECVKLVDVALPSTLKTIERGAFCYCSSLKHVEIPAQVTQIGGSAFRACVELTSVILPPKLEVISGSLFAGCVSLRDFEFPEGITEIQAEAFIGCDGLRELDIPETVKSIDKGAFSNCDNLEVLKLHEGLETIKGPLFDGTPKLREIVVPSTVTKVFKAFQRLNDKVVRFLGDAPSIDNYVFELSRVVVYYPSNNATWTEGVRQQYGGTVTWVEDVCAGKHTPVTDDEVEPSCTGEGLTQGQHCAVCGYVIVYQEAIPAKGHSFGEWIETKAPTVSTEGAAERQCTRCGEKEYKVLDKIFKPGQHEPAEGICGEALTWKIENGVLTISGTGPMPRFDKLNMAPWEKYAEVTREVILEEGVTTVGYYAFSHFTVLESVQIPSTVTYIDCNAFSYCAMLKTVELPEGLTHIGDCAFRNCKSLGEIHIYGEVNEIGFNAFDGCDALKKVWFHGDAPEWMDAIFGFEDRFDLTAYFPEGNDTWNGRAFADAGDNVTWKTWNPDGVDVEPTDPKPTEPKPTDPKPTEPKPTDPKPTEPEVTEPLETTPVETMPPATVPENTEPVETKPEADPVVTMPGTEPMTNETQPVDGPGTAEAMGSDMGWVAIVAIAVLAVAVVSIVLLKKRMK